MLSQKLKEIHEVEEWESGKESQKDHVLKIVY